MAIYAIKKKRSPKAKPGDRELWMDFGHDYLAGAVLCSISSIARATGVLVSLGFLTIHQPNRFDRRYWYQLNEVEIQKHIQELELFGTVYEEASKMTVSNPSKCRDRSQQNDGIEPVKMTACIYPSLSPLSSPSSSHPQSDDENENDPEKEHLIKLLGKWNVQKERVEHCLTNYTRQLIHLGINYTTQEMSRKSIQNPAGVLYRFMENPISHGYELRMNGTWGPKVAKSQWENLTMKRIAEEQALEAVT